MNFPDILKEYSPALVALSGGTDSMTLLASFVKEGLPVSAATVRSEFTVPEEITRAEQFARKLGVEWKVIDVSILSDEHLRTNPEDRCYICKKRIMQTLLAEADGKTICDGTHADDADEERPGKKALKELGIVSPFALSGIGKRGIISMAKELGVTIYPPSSCLATRIPFGEEITAENLKKIAESETFLREKGIRGILRVRLSGRDAVIETERDETARAELYTVDLKTFGFSTITFQEYKTGGGNTWSKIEQ
ncbi:Pyridinium-3,5-biscarboxylic acid mononucleotide sulfurtransferase [bioreactor metagenome]|uniref:Pyridinium-3,5-biscarboxylic acid mononucleotide sulfurtransferase n=1 Tax=bioreactor metagenome TaxID=1076179 RepID=A0A644UWM4_9ZZZZ|nr:ATP-dependent sacrificial sulfur transferase LarE [Methanocorpusculum sp.]